MDDSRWERYGAVGGVVFVVLDVVVAVHRWRAAGKRRLDRTEVASYFVDNRARRSRRDCGSSGLVSMALIWWSGSLWRRDGARRGWRGAVGGGVDGGVGRGGRAVARRVVGVRDAGRAQRYRRCGSGVFHTLAVLLLAASGFGVATHVLATSVLELALVPCRPGSWGSALCRLRGSSARPSSARPGTMPLRAPSGSRGSRCGVCGSSGQLPHVGAIAASAPRRPPMNGSRRRAYDMTNVPTQWEGPDAGSRRQRLLLFKRARLRRRQPQRDRPTAGVSHQTVLNHC